MQRTWMLASLGRGVATVVAMVALATVPGCLTSSTPPELYTLDMRNSGASASPVEINVGLLNVAEPLMQKNILIKVSPTQVEYYAVGQWAGGLDEMLREKLKTEFGSVAKASRTLVLSGNLLAFEQIDLPEGAIAHVKLEASIHESGKSRYSEGLLKKTYDITTPTESANPNGVATALSRAVEQLAAQIVADVSAL